MEHGTTELVETGHAERKKSRLSTCSCKNEIGGPGIAGVVWPFFMVYHEHKKYRAITTSILASLAPMPIASNALSGNFYTRFHLFLSIFRDF